MRKFPRIGILWFSDFLYTSSNLKMCSSWVCDRLFMLSETVLTLDVENVVWFLQNQITWKCFAISSWCRSFCKNENKFIDVIGKKNYMSKLQILDLKDLVFVSQSIVVDFPKTFFKICCRKFISIVFI